VGHGFLLAARKIDSPTHATNALKVCFIWPRSAAAHAKKNDWNSAIED
jgi:hypothetical protein